MTKEQIAEREENKKQIEKRGVMPLQTATGYKINFPEEWNSPDS
jgi:hypothetical protein